MTTEGTGADVTKQAPINNNLIQIIIMVIAALGAGGGGSWLATSGIESDIQTTLNTRLATLETKMDDWQIQYSDKVDDIQSELADLQRELTKEVDDLKRQMEKLEDDLQASQQDSQLSAIHLELIGKISDLDRALSDRLTRIETEVGVLKEKKRTPKKE